VAIGFAACAICSVGAEKPPLPDLDTVLAQATNKAQDFAKQAAAMQKRLSEQQERSREALAAKKKDYENQLQQIHKVNDAIGVQNSVLLSHNRELERANTEMFARLKGVQARNNEMWTTLQNITEKVSAAQLFITDSLKVTDESHADELLVLAPTTPKPTLDHFLDVASGRTVSLLSIGANHHDDPMELVTGLSDSLSDIKKAEDEGAAELKAHFMASVRQAEQRQAELNATQAELLHTQSQLEGHRAKLEEAEAHLQATTKQLQDRLQGLRVFADNVDASVASTIAVNTANSTSTLASNATPSTGAKSDMANSGNTTPAANVSLAVVQPVTALRMAATKVAEVLHAPATSISTKNIEAAGWQSWFAQLR